MFLSDSVFMMNKTNNPWSCSAFLFSSLENCKLRGRKEGRKEVLSSGSALLNYEVQGNARIVVILQTASHLRREQVTYIYVYSCAAEVL